MLGLFLYIWENMWVFSKNIHFLNLTMKTKGRWKKLRLRNYLSVFFKANIWRQNNANQRGNMDIPRSHNRRQKWMLQCFSCDALDTMAMDCLVIPFTKHCWILTAGQWVEQAQRKRDKQLFKEIEIWEGQAHTLLIIKLDKSWLVGSLYAVVGKVTSSQVEWITALMHLIWASVIQFCVHVLSSLLCYKLV